MLVSLDICDVVLIEKITIDFQKGFTVFTGETGAGKSILMDALSLALGARGDATLIRKGSDQSIVSATFSLKKFDASHDIFHILNEHGIDTPDDILILRRILHKTQRTRAFINDIPVGLQLLRRIGETLLEIHGQFDNLLNPTSHGMALDTFAKSDDFHAAQNNVKSAYTNWKAAIATLEHHQKTLEETAQKIKFYEDVVKDLSPLQLVENEVQELEKERESLVDAGKLADVLHKNAQNLEQSGMMQHLSQCQKSFERFDADHFEELPHIVGAFENMMREYDSVREVMGDLAFKVQKSGQRLHDIDDRLHKIKSMARKFFTTIDGLYPLFDEAQNAVNTFMRKDDIVIFERDVERLQNEFENVCLVLRDMRVAAGLKLSEHIDGALAFLKLNNARFRTQIVKRNIKDATNQGLDAIVFEIAANKGQDFTPLHKSASGGEMARIMLALKVVLAGSNAVGTIVFDEIDTGVGGAVAAAIGTRMRELGQHLQVFSISHSPQVAAYAHQHTIVYKHVEGAVTKTSLRSLDDGDRQHEIARMLSGDTITVEAKSAAKALLSAPLSVS